MERLLLECAVKAGLIAAGTGLGLRALRVRAAAARHAAWAGVVLAMLLLPSWTAWGPKAKVRVLPAVAEQITMDRMAPEHPLEAAPVRPESRRWSSMLPECAVRADALEQHLLPASG